LDFEEQFEWYERVCEEWSHQYSEPREKESRETKTEVISQEIEVVLEPEME